MIRFNTSYTTDYKIVINYYSTVDYGFTAYLQKKPSLTPAEPVHANHNPNSSSAHRARVLVYPMLAEVSKVKFCLPDDSLNTKSNGAKGEKRP